MRRWNRYGKQILAICIAAAAVIAIIAIAAGVGRSGSGSSGTSSGSSGDGGNVASVSETTSTESSAATETSETEETKEGETSEGEETTESSETTESTSSGKGGDLSGKAEEEEYTSESFYDDAVFIGDLFVYGIDEYEYIDSSRLYSATFMTAAKAMDLTDDVAASEPGKVFVMLGFDDDNLSEDRSAETSADAILELLEDLQDKLPSAKIYAVSELPITEEYNDNGGDYVSQADLDEINSLVKKGAEAAGIGYINVADSFKSGDYMSSSYTNDGCHVAKPYYPFILNGIAKVAK